MTTQTATLKTAIGSYGYTKGLKDGSVKPTGYDFEHVEVSPIIAAFRRMCRSLEFDVSEMAITTYLSAKSYGLPFTAIPVFLVRLSHAPIMYNVNSGVKSPKDLEGKKVGVRAYTVTAGLWSRAQLETEYGVDLNKVTWVLADEEHVSEFHKDAPPNASYQLGANLGEMVAKGELAAAIGVGNVDSPDVKPLIANGREADVNWCKKQGIYPINHTVVIKNSVLADDPNAGVKLFDAFKAAKAQWLPQLDSGAELPAAEKELANRRGWVGADPLPYGVAANRPTLEAAIRFATSQKILRAPIKVEDMFVGNTVSLG